MEFINELRFILQSSLKEVDALLLSIANREGGSKLIPQINHYLQGAGGKRIRPLLTLALAEILGGNNHKEQAVLLATSVELIHTATLLHDDVIDESPTRRGKTTTNQIWGNKTAILVGDYLFSHAFIFMVKAGDLTALSLLSTTSSIIAEAEVLQLEIINNPKLSLDTYLELIRAKTAVLFAAAAQCGALSADTSIQQHAYDYGLNIGMVYQMVDDVLDYFSEDDRFGKALYNDLREAKMTLPLLLLRDIEKGSVSLMQDLFAEDGLTEERLLALRELFAKHNILNHCSELIDKFVRLSQQSFTLLLSEVEVKNAEVKRLLNALPQELVNRSF